MFYKTTDTDWSPTASQGGVVRGCARWLLDNGYVKHIIGVLQGETPGDFHWGVTDDPKMLAKSVYKPLNPTELLKSLSEEEKSDALLIGLPCQTDKTVKYKITLFCSGSQKGNHEKLIINYRYGVKPDNFGVLYDDETYDIARNVKVVKLKEACKSCSLPYSGDMVVGDLHGTPFNLVETLNPLFDEYIRTIRHKELTQEVFTLLKIDS